MSKLYAIVYPAYSMSGDGLADLPYLVATPLHKMLYEQVCGYSLGHKVDFFNTLEVAKVGFEEAVEKNAHALEMQSAIVELNVEEGQVVGFDALYTPSKIQQLMKPESTRPGFFKPVNVPTWKETKITPKDITSKALAEINRQYQESNEKTFKLA